MTCSTKPVEEPSNGFLGAPRTANTLEVALAAAKHSLGRGMAGFSAFVEGKGSNTL